MFCIRCNLLPHGSHRHLWKHRESKSASRLRQLVSAIKPVDLMHLSSALEYAASRRVDRNTRDRSHDYDVGRGAAACSELPELSIAPAFLKQRPTTTTTKHCTNNLIIFGTIIHPNLQAYRDPSRNDIMEFGHAGVLNEGKFGARHIWHRGEGGS